MLQRRALNLRFFQLCFISITLLYSLRIFETRRIIKFIIYLIVDVANNVAENIIALFFASRAIFTISRNIITIVSITLKCFRRVERSEVIRIFSCSERVISSLREAIFFMLVSIIAIVRSVIRINDFWFV